MPPPTMTTAVATPTMTSVERSRRAAIRRERTPSLSDTVLAPVKRSCSSGSRP